MSIFDRAKRAISSKANSILDKAEDPRKMIELSLEEMKEHIAQARQDVIAAVAAEKQLRKKMEELGGEVDKWEQRAELAVKAGDDALAREALRQKARVKEQLDGAEKEREAQLGLALQLRERLQQMEQKHKEISAKKGTIVARAEIARAGGGSEALGAKGGSNAFETFRGIEEKIENDEAEVAALRELEGAMGGGMKEAELESKFRKLEKSTAPGSAVDDELAAMKARVRIKPQP
jgi:phage shock protein A